MPNDKVLNYCVLCRLTVTAWKCEKTSSRNLAVVIARYNNECDSLSSKYSAGLNTQPNHLVTTLEYTCLPETKETPAIRSALQIH
jgi:hypothetical protein